MGPINYGLYLGFNAKPWQTISQASVAQQHALGAFFDDEFGRRFRYALNGGVALVSGRIVQTAPLGGADTTLQSQALVTVISAIGDTRIFLKAISTAQVLDLYAEGWAAIDDVTDDSVRTRRIKGNSVLATSGTASYIDLYEGCDIALALNDRIALMVNPYKDIVVGAITATTATGVYLGGVNCDVPIANYCWVQTRGWFGTHVEDGNLAGNPVTIAATTAGTPTTNTAALYCQQFGISPAAWLDEGAGLIYLMCE